LEIYQCVRHVIKAYSGIREIGVFFSKTIGDILPKKFKLCKTDSIVVSVFPSDPTSFSIPYSQPRHDHIWMGITWEESTEKKNKKGLNTSFLESTTRHFGEACLI